MGKVLADRVKEATGVNLQWCNIEIHPETPEQGRNLSELFPSSMVEQMFTGLSQMGRKYDLEFNPHHRLANSRKAILLGEYLEVHFPERADRYHEAVFKAYFNLGQDIGSIQVLEQVVEDLGLEPGIVSQAQEDQDATARMEANSRLASREGINATPTFLIGGERIVGAQPLEQIVRVVERAFNKK